MTKIFCDSCGEEITEKNVFHNPLCRVLNKENKIILEVEAYTFKEKHFCERCVFDYIFLNTKYKANDEALAEDLTEIMTGDLEVDHLKAEKFILRVLKNSGFKALAERFEEFSKTFWHA